MLKETQKYTQWYIWLPLLTMFMASIGLAIFSDADKRGILILFVLTVLIATLFYSIKLITTYDNEGIALNFYPITGTRNISWDDIDSLYICTYKFVGYGIRLNKGITYYNISGNTGLKVILKSGEEIMIGTQKPTEITHFIKGLQHSNADKLVEL